jgi:hypothetical protein
VKNLSLNARGWYFAAKQGNVHPSYVRFIALWEALCAWSRDVLGESQDTQMKDWLRRNIAEWHKLKLGEADYGYRANQLASITPVWTMEGERQLDRRLSIADETDFSQVIEVIYKVRCNLMKGGKPAMPSQRDVEVCDRASDVLDAIVEHVLFGR